jgi:hypothetical protein
MRKYLMVAAVVMLPLAAVAAEEKLSGTYKLVSSTRTLVDSGQVETYSK